MVCLILGWGLWHSGAKIPHMLPSQPGTEVSANSNRSAVPPRHAFILLPLLYISIFPKLQVCCVGIQQVDLVTLIDAPVRRGSHATETDGFRSTLVFRSLVCNSYVGLPRDVFKPSLHGIFFFPF